METAPHSLFCWRRRSTARAFQKAPQNFLHAHGTLATVLRHRDCEVRGKDPYNYATKVLMFLLIQIQEFVSIEMN